jgi:hypothetical protein
MRQSSNHIGSPAKSLNQLLMTRSSNMAKNRDDFSSKDKSTLHRRVSGICSNPSCKAQTTGPSSDINAVNSVGVAAHICAAAPGGARYDASKTSSQRKSISNAIWLCRTCATKIDNDEITYPVGLLHAWKVESERLAKLNLGKPLLTERSANSRAVQETFFPSGIAPDVALRKTAAAIADVYREIDPRFNVVAELADGKTTLRLNALENVAISFSVKPKDDHEFKSQLTRLFEFGVPLEVSTAEVTFRGSPLFDELFAGINTELFRMTPNACKPVELALSLTSPDGTASINVPGAPGKVFRGSKSISYIGTFIAEVFGIQIQFPESGLNGQGCEFSWDMKPWIGKELTSIERLSELNAALVRIADG